VANLKRFTLRRLAFTGPNKPTRDLNFVDGLNVLWGASNAGKSFAMKALDYMFGASATLPDIKESGGYENCWLEMNLPVSGVTTLSRALAGGGFNLFHGTIDESKGAQPIRKLAASHSAKESLSSFLLAEIDIADKRVAKNLNGEKAALTFRCFTPYVFTEETPMMAEGSPIAIAPQSGETFDKNVLKFILTGVDDSAVVETQSVGDQRTANAGKIEIVEEMITATTDDLKRLFPDDDHVDVLDLEAQDGALSRTLDEHQSILTQRQSTLDRLRRERRAALDSLEELEGRTVEIAVTIERFALLATVYDSDVQRLESLEEGAAALMAGAHRPCPLCGADPEHQREAHGLDYVERSKRATSRWRAGRLRQRSRSVLRPGFTTTSPEQAGRRSLLGKI
jgi:hypothetical protein